MRRIAILLSALFACCFLTGGVALAGAHSTGGKTAGQANCHYTYDWGVKFGGSPQDGHADWETNCGNALQVLIYCNNIQAGDYTRTSGIVTSLELNDQKDCYAGDTMRAMYVRVNSGNWIRKWER